MWKPVSGRNCMKNVPGRFRIWFSSVSVPSKSSNSEGWRSFPAPTLTYYVYHETLSMAIMCSRTWVKFSMEVHIHWSKMYQKCCYISLLIPCNDGRRKTHLWTISGNFIDGVCTSNLGNFQRPNTKRVLYMHLGTTRLSGRPRNRWQDEVREDGRIVGGEGWQEKVHNREERKKLLRSARNRRISAHANRMNK